MESELYEAAVKGNVPSLRELLAKDKLLLDRIMTGNHTETPLHIAAMIGHLEFVEEVLARKAELARVQDSQGLTPLHLAAAKGYLNIVASLLRVSPEMCFVRDKYERNPLHVAAMKGHVDVLQLLVQARPDAIRSVVEHGQTILHLCVKHNRLEALKLLMDILGDDQFINSTDEDGNTILHLAAADRQSKTILFLTNKGVNQNITNTRGYTALALLIQAESAERASEIADIGSQTLEKYDSTIRTVDVNNMVTASHPTQRQESNDVRMTKWQDNMQNMLMVVAILIATIAFQAGMIETSEFEKSNEYYYKTFVTCNTISFIASLSVIILLISDLPSRRRFSTRTRISTWIVMLTTWVAITFTAVTYGVVIVAFSPERCKCTAKTAIGIAVLAWVGLMALIFLHHVVRLVRLVRNKSWRNRSGTIYV